MTLHSFAVLAYKDSPYLSDCLDSLMRQTTDSEVYLTTSTPSTYISDLARQYGIKVYVTEKGRGIAHDWNFSLQQAKTKYVTLAHQDDLYLPDYAENCVQQAERFRDTLIYFTDYTEIADGIERSDNSLLRIKRWMLAFFMPFNKQISTSFWKRKSLSFGCPIAAPSVMYNLENLSGFRFSTDFSINMDWDAWTRIAALDGRFVFVNKRLLKHRIHADSATTKGLEANLRQEEDLKMFKRFWPDFFAAVIARFYAGGYKSNSHENADK